MIRNTNLASEPGARSWSRSQSSIRIVLVGHHTLLTTSKATPTNGEPTYSLTITVRKAKMAEAFSRALSRESRSLIYKLETVTVKSFVTTVLMRSSLAIRHNGI